MGHRFGIALLALLGGCAMQDAVRADTALREQAPFVVRAAPFANLTAQLDCLALAEVHCSRDDVRALWASGWTAADDEALARWATVRRAVRVEGDSSESDGLPHPLPSREADAAERLRVAGAVSHDAAAWQWSATELVGAGRAAEGATVLAHFTPRFDAWWRSQGAPAADAARAELEPIVVREDLAALVERVRAFYGAPPVGPFTLHLIVTPGAAAEPSYASQLGEHALMELRPGDRLAAKVEVAAHELFHRFLATTPREQRIALLRRFVESEGPGAMAAWALLDEAVATALGNGLFARALYDEALYTRRAQAPLYGDPAIDAAARAILPLLEQHLAAGGSIGDEAFAAAYLAAVRGALGRQLQEPALGLRQLAIVRAGAARPAAMRLVGLLRASDAWETDWDGAADLLAPWPRLSAVFLVDHGDAAQLEATRALLGEPDFSIAQGGMAVRRVAARDVYVVGLEPGDPEAAIDRFAACVERAAPACTALP